MKHLPRILMVLAVAGLCLLYVLPLWRITLFAPQYPDGVTMFIWIHKIGGESPATLQNINILNHYIGMKYIEPDSIPELRYFPWVVGGLALLGLVAAAVNRRRVYLAWTVVFTLLAAAGVYDFYLWEYDYGHNLSEDAPMKFPGESFQPPLIGSKQIINFTAVSMPHTGGYAAGLALLLSAAAARLRRPSGRRNKAAPALRATAAAAAVALVALASGCTPKARPLDYGSDACAYCRMTVVDRQHGAEAVTAKGKVHPFDAVECLVGFLQDHRDKEFALLLVNGYENPGELIDAREAIYLISENLPSPMGANLSAFADGGDAADVMGRKGGNLHTWNDLNRRLGGSRSPATP